MNTNFRKSNFEDKNFLEDSYQRQLYIENLNFQNQQFSNLEPIELDPLNYSYLNEIAQIKRQNSESPFYNFKKWNISNCEEKKEPNQSKKTDFLTKVIVYRILPVEQERLVESFVAFHNGPIRKTELRAFSKKNNLNYQRVLGYLRAKCVEKQRLSIETEIGVLNQVRRLNYENERIWQDYINESKNIFRK